jgi:uncharacterized protein (TIGR02145 family)
MKKLLLVLAVITCSFSYGQDKMGVGYMTEGFDGAGIGLVTTWVKPFSCGIDSVLIDTIYYDVVTIGNQCWLAENLQYDDGSGGVYAYSDTESNVATYGRLYTWDAAVRVAASIDGWHLPTDGEWTVLINYLGGSALAGGKLKEVGTEHWLTPNEGATDSFDYTALPAGRRNNFGVYSNITNYGYWWSATETDATNAWYYTAYYNDNNSRRVEFFKSYAYSARLIKD